jgi:DNA-binding response OmpR family regulator
MSAEKQPLVAATDVIGKDFNPLTGKMKGRLAENCSPVRVLSVSPNLEDHAILRRILHGLPWEVSAVANCKEAIGRLSREPVSLIFCESVLEDGTWKNILGYIRKDAHAPLLIVTSRVADDFLWAEVLNLGGYDVLAKPLNPKEVRHVFATASLSLTGPATPQHRAAAG